MQWHCLALRKLHKWPRKLAFSIRACIRCWVVIIPNRVRDPFLVASVLASARMTLRRFVEIPVSQTFQHSPGYGTVFGQLPGPALGNRVVLWWINVSVCRRHLCMRTTPDDTAPILANADRPFDAFPSGRDDIRANNTYANNCDNFCSAFVPRHSMWTPHILDNDIWSHRCRWPTHLARHRPLPILIRTNQDWHAVDWANRLVLYRLVSGHRLRFVVVMAVHRLEDVHCSIPNSDHWCSLRYRLRRKYLFFDLYILFVEYGMHARTIVRVYDVVRVEVINGERTYVSKFENT